MKPSQKDAGRPDRLTAADLSMVWPEDFGWPQDIGALAILDGERLLDGDGRVRIGAVRDEIERRLHLFPRSRQVLHFPRRGLGWPLWVDANTFNLADHVRVHSLEPPTDQAELLAACEELRRRGLDRTRPLWEIWLLPGLPDRRVGLFVKLHHAIADGVAGVAAIAALLDFAPTASPPVAPPWRPRPVPSSRELFTDNVRRRLATLNRIGSQLVHPFTTLRKARRNWPAVREAFGEGRAPRSSINQPLGGSRRLSILRADLEDLKRIAHTRGAKVNDVMMTAVARGLRELLLSRGENVQGLALRAFVPVSLHHEPAAEATGNLDGAMVAPLPIGEPDDLRRLAMIAADTAQRKKKERPPGGTLFGTVAIQRAFLRHAARQRFMNTYLANVPGPPVRLYFAGAPVLEVFPVVPLLGNVTLGVGALSYAGQFNIAAVADGNACPDLDVFAEGMNLALEALTHAVLVHV
jgi:diacylglycerol O-acyltransferase / wax synthase